MGMREAYQEKVTAHLKDLSTKLADLRAKAGPAAARLKEVSEATWKEARPGRSCGAPCSERRTA